MAEFKLGRIKFVWKGAWAANTVYYKDDVVSAGGISYMCVAGHTAASTFAGDANYWQQMAGGTQWKGTWTATTNYIVGDIVSLDANIYYCNSNHTSQSDLNSDASHWDLYTAGLKWKGDWSSSSVIYRVNDLVKYGADVYICTTRHTSSASFDLTKFSVFTLGLQWEDAWGSGTTYQVGDITTYGGYVYVAKTININKAPPTNTSDWGVVTTGYNNQGTWSNSTAYKTGDVVQLGGWTYVAKADNTNQAPYIGTTGINSTYWNLVVKGFNHRGAYNNSSTYYPGDVVLVTSSTYVAIAVTSGVTPPNGTFWQIIGQGGVGASLTQRGDLAYREQSGAVVGLHMVDGTRTGAAVQDGYVLKAVDMGGGALEPRYGEFGYVANVWYVSPSGTDASGYGRTLDKPFRTIKYACQQATGPATIFIKTGTYQEQLPIRVPTNVSLVGDELRTTIVLPTSGLSDDGVTPNNRSRMFLMNNATVLRNMSFGGLTGQRSSTPVTAGSTVYPLTTNWPSSTASGAYVALDPTGVITGKSPYIQNCSCFGEFAVGLYVNGADQASGYKSMVCNDFTQAIDDGIGIHVQNGGRVEAVSVFTYYSYVGYLAQTGGVIRALNGNNSYGTYGDVATDIDPTDTGFFGTVNNRDNEATISKVWVGSGKVLAVGWSYQGQGYTGANISLDNAPANGTNASVTADIGNGVLSHVGITSGGANYQYVTGTGRAGGTTGSGVYFALAATDKATTDNQYLGMRITILDGTGAGQTATIKNSILLDTASGYTKVVYVQKADGSDGWDSLSGDAVITALDASTQYDIVPEIVAVGGSPSRPAVLKAGIDPASFQITSVHIIDGGAGYQTNPTFTITDPLGTSGSLSPQIKNGAISRVTYVSRGSGYVNLSPGTVTGDGFAEIDQTGTYLNFSGLTKAPRPGSIINISGQTSPFLVIQTVNGPAVGTGNTRVQVSTSVSSSNPLSHGASVSVYEKFSQIRLTGHDYLAIGSGNFASTAYPNVSTLTYVDANKHLSLNNGRVFYVSTDQDGNLSVGDLFQVNQATGQASLNVSSFNLTGLNSLQLGTGATVSQFSADSTLSANSDTIVPTQKAVRTYINSQLGSGSNNLQVNVLQAGKIYIQNNVLTTYTGTNSDLSLSADGTGIIVLNDTTNYPYTHSQVAAKSSSSIVNKDYVDQQFRTTMFGFVLDKDGNLLYTNDIGNLNATVDGSNFVDFWLGDRTTSVAINTSGNLQITY